MITVKVKLFAMARDLAGAETLSYALPTGSPAGEILKLLSERNREFEKWKDHLRLAVNWEYVRNDYLLHEDDEVAVIPPVSGG